ncbi:hypothetical protein LU290_05270 [Moraxella nasibovis]|uniref:hypothetical protein n=1 Tax=Moraxella nasibovis TaxID=2904120 RepID=UPI002410196D|nr:hypothetical protein [Moraxella nasibovis]WFF39632.1 hypothetical protein LU290_05270 [Moraxella nasibovis]
MIANQIDIDIINNYSTYDIFILIDNQSVFELECFDLQINFNSLFDLLTKLEKDIVSEPIFFELTDYCCNPVILKISPYPPFDWIVLNIPDQNDKRKFFIDRQQFCYAIKIAVEKFTYLMY